jgi:hypothetical protein
MFFGGKYELPNEIIGKDGATMVLIPAGDFQMAINEPTRML